MASVSPLSRLVLLAWCRSLGLVHGGAIVLLGLVIATESAGLPLSAALSRLLADVPHTWALLSPALTLAATALTMDRLRANGELLALGALGLSRPRFLLTSLAVTLPSGALAAAVGVATDPATEAARVPGAWLVRGVVLLDPGTLVVPDLSRVSFGPSLDWPGTGLLVVAGGLAGASLGARGGRRSVLAAAAGWLVLDLVRRGSDPAVGFALLLCAAIAGAADLWMPMVCRAPATESPARS